MIEVLTLPNGLSAEEVEKLVTVPTEYGLAGMRDLEAMRSISLYGLSDIRCYFSWDSDYYWDRVETINRLSFITLPQGVTPGISPDNPIGEIYRYTVESPDHDLINEKTVEDWILEKQIKTVPGVEDVSGFGGLTKQYQVEVDPHKLNYYQVPLSTLIAASAELEHQLRRQLSERRRAGVRRARARLFPQSRRHPQRRAQHQQVHPDQSLQRRRR